MNALRWLKRLTLLLVVLAAAVLLGGPVLLSSDFGRTRVESSLSHALGREVSLGSLDVGFFFSSLSASDVEMGHPDGFPEGKTVAIRSMQIECGLRDLLDGKVSGRLAGTGVNLVVLKKGERTTLDGLGGSGEGGEGDTPPLDLEVDLDECNFMYADLDSKEETHFKEISLHAHLKDGAGLKNGVGQGDAALIISTHRSSWLSSSASG